MNMIPKTVFNAEEEAFDEVIPHLQFPSDNLKWGTIRKQFADMESGVKWGPQDFSETLFANMLDEERTLAFYFFIKKKYGENARDPYGDGTELIDSRIAINKDALKECYTKAGMYHLHSGDNLFEQQVRSIETSLNDYLKGLEKK